MFYNSSSCLIFKWALKVKETKWSAPTRCYWNNHIPKHISAETSIEKSENYTLAKDSIKCHKKSWRKPTFPINLFQLQLMLSNVKLNVQLIPNSNTLHIRKVTKLLLGLLNVTYHTYNSVISQMHNAAMLHWNFFSNNFI